MRISDWSSDVCSSDLRMDLNQSSSSDVKKINTIEDLFDDIDFKPLTDGLGFHGSQKADEAFKNARQQVINRASPARQMQPSEHPFTTHQKGMSAKEIGRASCREKVGQYV